MYLLKIDVRSHFNGKLYGSAGDEVKMIRCTDDGVAIVEDSEGSRFPCRMEMLVTDSDKVEESTEPAVIVKPYKKSRSKTTIQNIQKPLF